MDNADADIEKAEAAVVDAEAAVEAKKAAMVEDEKNSSRIKEDAEAAEKEYARLQQDYQNMCAGISSSESEDAKSLPQQISQALADANDAKGKIKQSKMKVEHLGKSAKKFEADMKKQEAASRAISQKKEKAEKKVADLTSKLSSLNFNETYEAELHEKKKSYENKYTSIKEDIDTLTAQLSGRLSFNYADPVRGFDRDKVKGLVARLIT